MKKTNSLFSFLLVIVFVFTSIGAVSADEAPPPLDGQTLEAPALTSPTGNQWTNYGVNFIWGDVAGADKYLLEVQRKGIHDSNYKNAVPPVMVYSKDSPIPPRVATLFTKKPLVKGDIYRWRVTAINTDVGIDSAGYGQSSSWRDFYTETGFYAIIDMFPDTYSGVIDFKKGDGTNSSTPQLNWIVDNGGNAYGNISASTQYFTITVSQGKNKYAKTIPAAGNCSTYTFSNLSGQDAICSTPFGSFTPPLTALEEGVTYTWEVAGLDQPDPVLFPNPAISIPAIKDTLQYNPNTTYPVLTSVITADTPYTNKPAFNWNQPAGGLPPKGSYQLVVEGDDTTKSGISWKTVAAPAIVPGKTKIPGTNTIACPDTLTPCLWVFKTPFNPNFQYRWNVRIAAGAGRFGPWASPGTSGGPDDMVRDVLADIGIPSVYDTINGAFNYFTVPQRPSTPEIVGPPNGFITPSTVLSFLWYTSAYKLPFYYGTTGKEVTEYGIDLVRTFPAPLSQQISVDKVVGAGGLTCGMGTCGISSADFVPTDYAISGLPCGIYRFTVTAKPRLGSGQAYFASPPLKSTPVNFTIAPLPPNISAAAYNSGTKKLSVTFNKNTSLPDTDIKYRILVKMQSGSQWRWVKTGTYTGTNCYSSGAACTLEFSVYKPGTHDALDAAGVYVVRIQEAAKVDTLWGPFGIMGGDFAIPAW